MKIKTSGSVNGPYTTTSKVCDTSNYHCVGMPGGDWIRFYVPSTFTGTASTNAMYMYFNADDEVDGTPTSEEKSVPL